VLVFHRGLRGPAPAVASESPSPRTLAATVP